jgi:hypothetical protein
VPTDDLVCYKPSSGGITDESNMTSLEVQHLVENQIGDAWETTNYHNVDLRQALVTPQKITVIERGVEKGKLSDRLVQVWLVLVEKREDNIEGYRIVMKENEPMFGLASEGFPNDKHIVLCGWYGDFMSTFLGM